MPKSSSISMSSRTQSGLKVHSATWPRWLTRRTRSSDGVTTISSLARAARKLTLKAHQITSTSRPKKPSTGHAPIIRKTMPVTKLTMLRNSITARKPVRFSDRWGVSRAARICTSPSLSDRSRSISLPVLIVPQYIPIMAKIIKPAPRKAAVPKKKAKTAVAKPKPPAKKSLKAAKPNSTKPWTPAEIREVFSRFRKANPEPKGELEHLNPFTLLVAVVLSAQATDAGVNKATRELFRVADTPQKMLDLGEERLRDYIKTIGLYRTKAKNVIALSEKLIAEFGGEVPRTRDAIESLPGAGRKTANVVLNMAFNEHTIAVDTHVFRVSNRTGLAPGNTPLEVELELERLVPPEFMLHAHHWLILHGRYTCLTRKPRCEVCLINDLCRWPEKTV